MLRWLRGKSAPGRESLLAAVPVKNTLVRETRGGESQELGTAILRLDAPLAESGLAKVLARRAARKSFDLDELGAFVWDAADGRRTVEGLIRFFAEEKRVNLREAEVAVLAFLKMLARRNLVALAVDPKKHPGAKAPGKNKT